MAITQRRMTLAEFLELPEEEPYLELVDGMVVQKVAPQWLHSVLQPDLAAIINRHARPRKLAVASTELRATIGRYSLVPDVAVYRWERLPRSAAGKLINVPAEPPDVVDPKSESIVGVHPDGSTATLRGRDRVDLAPVLPDFELTVQELFDALRVD